jgi:hypothetical protein
MVEVKTGYQIIADILAQPDVVFQSQVDFPKLLEKLVPYIEEYSRKRIETHKNLDCGTIYTENSCEHMIWALGLICEEWTLEILRLKTVNGHCYNHKLPCPKGSKFHKELYGICQKSFKEELEKPL